MCAAMHAENVVASRHASTADCHVPGSNQMSAFVVFFGGQDASPSDMDKWLNSARGQEPNLEFSAFPWPHGERQHKSAVAAIEASNANTVYLVGHSSGCASANAVDKNSHS